MPKKLKILCTNNAPLIKYGIAEGFRKLGHEVYIMDGDLQLWHRPKEEQTEIFRDTIEKLKVDICFSECFANFSEDIFNITTEKGIFHAFFSIEDTPFDHWIGDHWSNYADYIFTTTAECLPNYWNKGKNAEVMLFGCNPDFHKKVNTEMINDIVLMANNYERRSTQTKEFIVPLIENNYNISIYGNEWWMDETRTVNLLNHPNVYKGYGAYEDLPQLYSSSKIILGQNLDDKSITQTSMRPMETLSIGGGLLISPYSIAQEYLFHDHVYLPKNKDEMIQMVDEVLSMSEKQRAFKAKAAQRYVYKYHNYSLRAKQVINAYMGVRN